MDTKKITKENQSNIQEEEKLLNPFKALGFDLYRLKEAKEDSDFIIYDDINKMYDIYSTKKGLEILYLSIKERIEKTTSNNISVFYYFKNCNFISKDVEEIEFMKVFKSLVNNYVKLIDNINYSPIDDLIFDNNNRKYFNTYVKSNLLSLNLDNYNSDKSKWHNINKVLANLTGNDEKALDYFCKWLAFIIKNPQEKLATSILLQGEQGSGKTLFCNHILKPLFEKNFVEVSQSDISSEFNGWLMGRQIIFANEVIYNDKNLNYSQKLKNYVTDRYVPITKKFKDTLNLKNYSHWIFSSNNLIPIKIEKGDRRFSVFKSKKLDNGVQIYMNIRDNQEELLNFLKYLYELEVKFDEVNTPYNNEAKKDIIDASGNSIETFIESLNEAGSVVDLEKDIFQSDYSNICKIWSKNETKYITIDSFYRLYVEYCKKYNTKGVFGRNAFTSHIKNMGFNTAFSKDTDNKTKRCFVLNEVKANE